MLLVNICVDYDNNSNNSNESSGAGDSNLSFILYMHSFNSLSGWPSLLER